MKAFKITEVKNFMEAFLTTDAFDVFLLEKAEITTYNSFSIDGRLSRQYYSREEWEDASTRPYDYSPWSSMRGLCFDLIKGKRTPSSMNIVLRLIPDYMNNILKEGNNNLSQDIISSFVINVRFDSCGLEIVTAVSYNSFSTDKSADELWDIKFQKFLGNKNIAFELL